MGLIKTTHKNISLPRKTNLYRQSYDRVKGIDGVHILKVNTFADDFGGWFKETMRLNEKGENIALKELGVDFVPLQVNTSYLAPKTKRFWHIHPTQNEIWSTSGTLLLGLVDFRPNSPTYKQKMKIIVSTDKMVYIPFGVAHGFINQNNDAVTLTYFTNKYFTADENTQEYRINPKKISYAFVKSELM